MRFQILLHGITASALALAVTSTHAALIVNPPILSTEVVRVQPVVVSDDDGGNTAEFFGTTAQQAQIESLIDSIWAQAGVDVEWLVPNRWSNTSANNGSLSLAQIGTRGAEAGVTHPDPYVLDLFFVEITYGSVDNGENSVNGFGWIGANGIMEAVGDNLPGFPGGQEVVASVTAHEIGHNLGLDHIVETQNLMQASGSSNSGERLNSSQITTAIQSRFTVAVAADSADFDADGDTDGIDFLTWQRNLGGTGSEGDADHDLDIDGEDLLIWQNDFGNSTGSGIDLLIAAPEPATGLLAMLLLLTWVGKRAPIMAAGPSVRGP